MSKPKVEPAKTRQIPSRTSRQNSSPRSRCFPAGLNWLGGDRKYDNVLGEGLESRSILLFDSNGNMAGFSGFDIVHGAGFS